MLPKIPLPQYPTVLPLSKKEVVYRPFTVREEKLLLLAKEMKDYKEILRNVLQVVDYCTLEKLDLNELPLTDLEWLFLKVRSKSVGETSDLVYSCLNEVDGKLCNSEIHTTINLEDVGLDKEPPDPKIELSNGIGIVLKFPNVDSAISAMESDHDDRAQTAMMFSLVEYIYDATQVYSKTDMTIEEFSDWLDSLPSKDFEKIENFFKSFPKFTLSINLTCPVCKNKSKVSLTGLQDFF